MSDRVAALAALAVLVAVGFFANGYFANDGAQAEPPPPRPTGLIPVSTSPEGSVTTLDAGSVSGPRTARRGWITDDHSENAKVSFRTAKELWFVNCDTTETRKLSTATFDAKGEVVNATDLKLDDAPPVYFPPNSMGDAVVDALCDARFDPPAS